MHRGGLHYIWFSYIPLFMTIEISRRLLLIFLIPGQLLYRREPTALPEQTCDVVRGPQLTHASAVPDAELCPPWLS